MSAAGVFIYVPIRPGFGTSLVREVEVPGSRPGNPGEVECGARRPAPAVPARGSPESFVDRQLVQATALLQRAEARLVAKEGALLARLVDTRGFERLGCSSAGDFAREILRMEPRTARNRAALGRTLANRPALREAYLAGAVSACQVLVLRPILNDENEAEWIERCADLSVRALAQAVREARETSSLSADANVEDASAEELDPDMRSISFSAPASVRVAWDIALETARMTLGWDAPVYRCVEAILAEAAPGACPETPPGPEKSGRCRVAVGDPRAAALRTTDPGVDGADERAPAQPCRRALQTLREVSDLLNQVRDLIDEASSDDAHALLNRIRGVQALDRPLRVLFGRLVRDLIETRAIYRLGYLRVRDFLEQNLHISERAARDLVRESEVFADSPAIEAAWSGGRIGLRQALVIHRVAPLSLVEAFIGRAESVTLRQFAREMRVIGKLQDLGMHRFVVPLPQDGLERAIVRRLRKLGWTDEKLGPVLDRFGVTTGLFRRSRHVTTTTDPAQDALLMRRLEVLVDLLLLSTFENAAERWDDLALAEADRQMFSAAAGLADQTAAAALADLAVAGLADPTPAAALAGAPDRQTFSAATPAGMEGAGTTVTAAATTGIRKIRFTAPEPIARHWQGAIAAIQEEPGGLKPVWLCVLKLLRDAVETWHTHDPETIPTMRRILERDGYLCQVPGCSNRRHLEVHHVRFRSRGGGNSDQNLITLCHAHHQRGIHRGYIRLTGAAPHDLTWQLGSRPTTGSASNAALRPVMQLRGERIER